MSSEKVHEHRGSSDKKHRPGTMGNVSTREILAKRVEALLANVSDELVTQALSEDDVGTLVTLASEEALGRELTSVDKARLRGAKYRSALIERAGGTLSVGQVAQLLAISQEAVRKAIRDQGFIAFPGSNGYALPAVQFEDGHELRGLRKVLRALSVESPWMRLDWLLSPEPRLEGRVPADALREGKAIEAVKRAAELVGEQGAA